MEYRIVLCIKAIMLFRLFCSGCGFYLLSLQEKGPSVVEVD